MVQDSMISGRKRLLIVAAAIAVVGASLWWVIAPPPEIERSRGLKLGMTKPEIEKIMGFSATIGYEKANGEKGVMFGSDTQSRLIWRAKVFRWFGLSSYGFKLDAWPVRVRFDKNGRADRIERRGRPTEEGVPGQ